MILALPDLLGPALFVSFFFVWLAVVVVGTGLWIWMLVDSCQRPDWVYAHTGSSKTTWVVVVALLGIIGALVYLIAERPKLKGLQEAYERGELGLPAPPASWGTPGSFCTVCGSPAAVTDAYCARCGARHAARS
jgi:hypothetical protein